MKKVKNLIFYTCAFTRCFKILLRSLKLKSRQQKTYFKAVYENKLLMKLSLFIFLFSVSRPALADVVSDSNLNLKLINDYRHGDKESYNDDPNKPFDAWVQGFMLDFESGKLFDVVGVEANLYRTERLRADYPNKSTRFYLKDGDESFTIPGAALTLDFADWAQFKIGRFGTDFGYGSLKYNIPFIDDTSVRNEPTLSEGVLWQGDFDNLHLFGMYSRAHAGGYYPEWTDGAPIAPVGGDVSEARYVLAGVWDKDDKTAMFGTQYQEENSIGYWAEGAYSWKLESDATVKSQIKGIYAHGIEDTVENNDTYVATGKISYTRGKTNLSAAVGQVGNKFGNIRFDETYTDALSIDRNHHDMFSWNVTGSYRVLPSTSVGLSVTVTDGYADRTEEVNIEGVDAGLFAVHRVTTGPLKGLSALAIFSKAEEYYKGDGTSDRLDHYDIKIKLTYGVKLF